MCGKCDTPAPATVYAVQFIRDGIVQIRPAEYYATEREALVRVRNYHAEEYGRTMPFLRIEHAPTADGRGLYRAWVRDNTAKGMTIAYVYIETEGK